MSARHHSADTSSGVGYLQPADGRRDLRVGTGALVHHPSLGTLQPPEDTSTPCAAADAPLFHPGFQRKEGPTRLTQNVTSAGAQGELGLSAWP